MTAAGKMGLGFSAAVVVALVWGLSESRVERPRPSATSPAQSATLEGRGQPSPLRAVSSAHPVAPAPHRDEARAPSPNLTEEALMHELEQVAPYDAVLALDWIAKGNRRFGADERRSSLEVQALTKLQRMGEARAAAERFLRDYPDSDEARDVARLTGVHARR